MQLLYPHEHTVCYNYKNGQGAEIEKLSIDKGMVWNTSQSDNKIIFVIKGCLDFSIGDSADKTITSRQLLLVPSEQIFVSTAKEDTDVIIFRLKSQIKLCDTFSLEKLMDIKCDISEGDLFYLNVDERLDGYFACLDKYLTSKLCCFYFFQMKTNEFFYLLRAYYPKEELRCFFNSIISNNVNFSSLIYQNYKNNRTTQELATILNYSLSGFQKRFKKVFGVSAYHWLTEQRMRSIIHEINCNEKSFKEISSEYGFSSPSHFNDFCKLHFGDTPGGIRESRKKKDKISKKTEE